MIISSYSLVHDYLILWNLPNHLRIYIDKYQTYSAWNNKKKTVFIHLYYINCPILENGFAWQAWVTVSIDTQVASYFLFQIKLATHASMLNSYGIWNLSLSSYGIWTCTKF